MQHDRVIPEFEVGKHGSKWKQVGTSALFRAFVLMRLNQTLGCQLHITKCRGWLQSKDSKSGSGRN